MSPLLPQTPWGGDERSDLPEPRLQGVLSREEQVGRWEVRAAQWRAMELAHAVFGEGARGTLLGIRHVGGLRGLFKLDVPFHSLDAHREKERAFLGMVDADPLMRRVPLVFVFGADVG